jgi:hypothetical protein
MNPPRDRGVIQEAFIVGPAGLHLWLHWSLDYANTLDGSELKASFWKGTPPADGFTLWKEPRQLGTHRFRFDLLSPDRQCWVLEPRGPAIDPSKLADHLLKLLADEIAKRLHDRI